MTKEQIETLDPKSRLREILADLEHQQWAHWTKYMLDNLTPENIARWELQIITQYECLSEKEKESDREWAHKVIVLLEEERLREHSELMQRINGRR